MFDLEKKLHVFFLVQWNQKVDYWWSNRHDLQSWVMFLQEGYCCFEKTDHLPSSEEEELKWQGTTQVLLAVNTTIGESLSFGLQNRLVYCYTKMRVINELYPQGLTKCLVCSAVRIQSPFYWLFFIWNWSSRSQLLVVAWRRRRWLNCLWAFV